MLDVFAVAVVMIRLLAILIIVNATQFLAYAFFRQQSFGDEFGFTVPDIATLVALLSYPVLAAVLLIFSTKIGRVVVRGLDNTVVQLDQTHYPVLQAAVFSVLGGYVLVYSLPGLVNIFVFGVLPALREGDGALVKTRVPVDQLVQELLKTVLGIGLVFGWRKIAASIRSMWKKGISVESSE